MPDETTNGTSNGIDWNQLIEPFRETVPNYLLKGLMVLFLLILGWIIAAAVRVVVRGVLRKAGLNKRFKSASDTALDLESTIGSICYYVILILVVIAAFGALRIEGVSDPLNAMLNPLLGFIPKLLAGGILALVAWVVATLVRRLVVQLARGTRLDEKLTPADAARPFGETLGIIAYALVILLFLPAILAALELEGILEPVRELVSTLVSYIPNVAGALLLGLVGWFVAKLLRDLTTSVLEATHIDRLVDRAGLADGFRISALLGVLVQILVFVPTLIAALQVLEIEAISAPATEMLDVLMGAVPHIIGAALIILLALFVARLVLPLARELLARLGFDNLPEKIGLARAFETTKPSTLAAKIIYIAIMLFAVVAAAEQLGFELLSDLLARFIEFGGQVLLGSAILVIGLIIANLAATGIAKVSGERQKFFAGLARVAILALVLAMALRAMGVADDIVNTAFTLTFGAVAVALALSFGIGGRKAAGRIADKWATRIDK